MQIHAQLTLLTSNAINIYYVTTTVNETWLIQHNSGLVQDYGNSIAKCPSVTKVFHNSSIYEYVSFHDVKARPTFTSHKHSLNDGTFFYWLSLKHIITVQFNHYKQIKTDKERHLNFPYASDIFNLIWNYHKVSNMRRTLVDHSDVVGASPVGLLQLHLHSRLNTWLQRIG